MLEKLPRQPFEVGGAIFRVTGVHTPSRLVGMSDPAIVAASRACEGTGLKPRLPSASEVNAAREALKPIRELHYPREGSVSAMYPDPLCNCDQDWPCDTARLVYPESELS